MVFSALNWLAEHQLADGSWSFNQIHVPTCRGQCRNPGTLVEARHAATGLALLAFLGTGQTHTNDFKYKSVVKDGLSYLARQMKVGPEGGDLSEFGGRMYSHGICALALCEAYAMSGDKGLREPAQRAIDFICYAQDPVGGGWRYTPRQAGDTSVTGWQLSAMKSGHLAYLHVPPATVKKAAGFLDSVQAEDGAKYGYTKPGTGPGTTAIGLLSRIYLGWKKDNAALKRGVEWIADEGPSEGNMYYNYYAAQVMRHWGGEECSKWNRQIRDFLADCQATEGHEAGSWYFHSGDLGAQRGGRLYCTAMATMILEVYYRHLPIYRKQEDSEALPAN
jgi:hypothetical protein